MSSGFGAVNGWWRASSLSSELFHSNNGKSVIHRIECPESVSACIGQYEPHMGKYDLEMLEGNPRQAIPLSVLSPCKNTIKSSDQVNTITMPIKDHVHDISNPYK
eukprot:TRINITY_DN1829_c0_g1_i7.p1 TRINITY_DN1829_c0_g1~~TRINITY_DN1829_c0_g1_i7.p1  ORF type:complete len:105 (-),score=8.16 TRINITY_DN1829_c0_g1_i7:563-877(-)